MNSLIVTDTHILFGEWSSIRENYVLNDLRYIVLSKPIKEVLKSQNAILTVLKEALDGIPVNGNRVAIVIDDELLFHDKFTCEESLTKREIWDYIQWETKQKWDELGSYYTTFAEIDSPNPNALHSITCPTFLISEIKAIVANQGGKPIWAGPVSTIYLENKQYRNAIYMTDDDSFIKFFYRDRDGYSEGKLRFIAGQPNVTVGIGDKEEQINIFKSPDDAREYVTIDLITDTKNTYLHQYRHKRIIPFEGINVKIDDIPEDISFKLLNALSILIRDFSFDNIVDFFNPTKIQDQKYEGADKISFNQSGEQIDNADNTDTKGVKSPTKRTIRKKKEKKDKKKRKKSTLLPFLLIILLGSFGYYLFYTENGKLFKSHFKEKIVLQKSKYKAGELRFFDKQFIQSNSLVKTYSELLSIVSPDSLISLNLIDSSGSIEMIGKDSITIQNIKPINYLLEPINCCGGIKQKVEFNIDPLPDIRSNILITLPDIIEQLQSTVRITKIRQLDMISENGRIYTPIIIKTDSFDLIDKTMQYLKNVGDNVIIRKVDITNTPPISDHSCTFYIAVFEPS